MILFTYTSKSNFNGLQNLGINTSNTDFQSIIFCVSLGNFECGEDYPFYDTLDEGCYTAASCPITTVDPGIVPTPPSLCKICS